MVNLFKFRRRSFSTAASNHLKILFFGTDNFSLASLSRLSSAGHQITVVTSFKAKENPIRHFANKRNLNLFDWPLQHSVASGHNVGVVVSFGHLIPESIISTLPLGVLNVHGSLLPKLRGAAPINYALRQGLSETGVTIMKIAPKRFDVGEILAQRKVLIGPDEVFPELYERMATEGADLLLECLEDLPEKLKNAKKQDEKEASYAPKLNQRFLEIRWEEMTGREVYDLYRALYSLKSPLTQWHGEIIKLKEVRMPQGAKTSSDPPGTVKYLRSKACLTVSCRSGTLIEVTELGTHKKSRMSAKDFQNGYIAKVSPEKSRFE